MFSIKLFALLAFVATAALALPTVDELEDPAGFDGQYLVTDELDSEEPIVAREDVYTPDAEAPITIHRAERVTCDLLSPFNVGHAACAAHCIRRGYRGGYCNGRGVCVCRR